MTKFTGWILFVLTMTALLASMLVIKDVYAETINYKDGSTYIGATFRGEPSGEGKHISKDGLMKMGFFAQGKYVGDGKRLAEIMGRPNLTPKPTYIGESLDGKRHGQGTYTWPNGDTYVGSWRDDVQHGQGTTTWSAGGTETAEWVDGVKQKQVATVEAPSNTVKPQEKSNTTGATFEETISWILEKVNKYQEPTKHAEWDGYEGRRDRWVVFNKYGDSNVHMNECKIWSGIYYFMEIYRYPDYERKVFSKKENHIFYDSFELSDLVDVDYDDIRLWGSEDSYGDRAVYMPVLRLKFRSNVGKFSHVFGEYRSGRLENDHKGGATNTLNIFFNYDDQENKLVERMKTAFLHLRDLTKNNPNCQKAKETF